MLSDYEYAQAVMKAAGVVPRYALCACGHEKATHGPNGVCLAIHTDYSGCSDFVEARKVYPCPLTTGDGFIALWDALEAKGWRVEFRTLSDGTLAQVYKADEMGRVDLGSIFQGGHEDRKAALVEAAGRALGVSRG